MRELVSGSGLWGPQGPAVTWGNQNMIMGSGPRLRTCVELVEHGVDAAGHAPAATDRGGHRDRSNFLMRQIFPSASFDPWQQATSVDARRHPFAETFAEVREA